MKPHSIKYLAVLFAASFLLSFATARSFADDQMINKEKYQKKIESRINKLEEEIKNLKAQASALEDGEKKRIINEQAGALEKAKEEAKARFKQLKEASIDGWQSLKEGVNSAVNKVQRDYYAWKAENQLNEYQEKIKQLDQEIRAVSKEGINEMERGFNDFDQKYEGAKQKLFELKSLTMDNWQELQLDVELALDEMKAHYQYLARKVKLQVAKVEKLNYQEKLEDLKKKVSEKTDEVSDDFKMSMENLNDHMDNLSDKIYELSVSNSDTWKEVNSKLDEVLDQLRQSYNKAVYYLDSHV